MTESSHHSHADTHQFSRESFDACVFVGGNSPHLFIAPVVRRARLIVAADSGWKHALSVGATPMVVLGDFDSITAAELHDVHEAGVPLIEYPSDKDLTDAEIALRYVADSDATSLLIVSGGGDRFDHLLSLLHALCDHTLDRIRCCAVIGDTRIDIVSSSQPLAVSCDHGQLVSLIPITGDASGVTTTGLRWTLRNDTLRGSESRGVSNVAMESYISVSLTNGYIAVLQPHYFPPIKEMTS